MANDADPQREVEDADDAATEDEATAKSKAPRPSYPFPRLDAFSSIQRQLAAIDFSALSRAQRAIEQSNVFKIPEIAAAQEAVAKKFAQSVDFARLADPWRRVVENADLANVFAVQKQWAEALASSIDFPALNGAIESSASLAALSDTNAALMEGLRRQADVFTRISETLAFKVPTLDVSALIAAVDRWIPANLRRVEDLEGVATIALDEGVPLSWIPRTEIVVTLLQADDAEARSEILDARRSEILDDCDAALDEISHEWAVQCRHAVAALRSGLDAPAQSHASNIIDSIVLALHGMKGRELAKTRAQDDFDDLPLQLAAENLTLRPLFRAFTSWWPTSGTLPPDYFARHATSHAVGHVGVFAPRSALIAVMLATSLTIEYAPDEPGGHD